MQKQSIPVIPLFVSLLCFSFQACTEKPSSIDPPQPNQAVSIRPPQKAFIYKLVMPEKNTEDPCDDLEKMKALAKKADGGVYIGCGTLPRFSIRKVMEAHKEPFSLCLRHAKNTPGEKRFKFHWTVKPDGTVHDVKAKTASKGEEAMQQCISAEILKLKFPKPMGGGVVELNWPFIYAPVSVDK